MYRVIAIMAGALALAGCSSSSEWLNLDALKPKPPVEAVRFESVPPGAQVKLPNGQVCLTPCASPLDSNGTYTVEVTLNGYQPATATIAPKDMGNGGTKLQPNPVVVQLTKVEPPKKPRRRRRTTKKKMTKPAPNPAPKPAAMAPAPQQSPSPWPPAQPPQR
jgi:cell division septation protein DedD